MASLKDDVVAIVDEHSGGIKGLELMVELMNRRGSLSINPETFFGQMETLIEKEIPELGFLRYGNKLDENLLREKAFIFRRLGVRCPACKG
jgi:hypothetical protein